jgi:cytochrome c oxidase subunit 4
MNKNENFIPYRQVLLVLAGLIVLTLISAVITQIYPTAFSIVTALLIAALNSFLILRFFMLLRYENRLIKIMLFCIVLILSLIIVITLAARFYR